MDVEGEEIVIVWRFDFCRGWICGASVGARAAAAANQCHRYASDWHGPDRRECLRAASSTGTGGGIVGASTTVITAEDIERSPEQTLPAILSREPGIQVHESVRRREWRPQSWSTCAASAPPPRPIRCS